MINEVKYVLIKSSKIKVKNKKITPKKLRKNVLDKVSRRE
jgi:hypothetical protein